MSVYRLASWEKAAVRLCPGSASVASVAVSQGSKLVDVSRLPHTLRRVHHGAAACPAAAAAGASPCVLVFGGDDWNGAASLGDTFRVTIARTAIPQADATTTTTTTTSQGTATGDVQTTRVRVREPEPSSSGSSSNSGGSSSASSASGGGAGGGAGAGAEVGDSNVSARPTKRARSSL